MLTIDPPPPPTNQGASALYPEEWVTPPRSEPLNPGAPHSTEEQTASTQTNEGMLTAHNRNAPKLNVTCYMLYFSFTLQAHILTAVHEIIIVTRCL